MKKIFLWMLPVAALLMVGCSKEEIDTWDESNGYAWFTNENTDFTFKKAPDVGVGEATLVGIPFEVAAAMSSKDRTVNVEVAKQPSDSRTKFEVQTPVVFHANHTVDTMWVKVWNSEHLNTVHDTITFRITASDDFLPGQKAKIEGNLCLYNGYARPSWWDSNAEYYLGYFTQTKMEVFYAVFGNDDDPRGSGGSWYNNMAVDYAIIRLNKYVEENHVTYPDDDPDHPGETPVFDFWEY